MLFCYVCCNYKIKFVKRTNLKEKFNITYKEFFLFPQQLHLQLQAGCALVRLQINQTRFIFEISPSFLNENGFNLVFPFSAYIFRVLVKNNSAVRILDKIFLEQDIFESASAFRFKKKIPHPLYRRFFQKKFL